MKNDTPTTSQSRSSSVVLIVDDDPLPLMIAVDVAEQAGFIILEASNADQATDKLESRIDIDILRTDINMREAWTDWDLPTRYATAGRR
jgi:CheY-like chemotaxis protein